MRGAEGVPRPVLSSGSVCLCPWSSSLVWCPQIIYWTPLTNLINVLHRVVFSVYPCRVALHWTVECVVSRSIVLCGMPYCITLYHTVLCRVILYRAELFVSRTQLLWQRNASNDVTWSHVVSSCILVRPDQGQVINQQPDFVESKLRLNPFVVTDVITTYCLHCLCD